MSSATYFSYEQIEAELHRLLGHFFVAFAGVEMNLSLRVGGDGTFAEKLDRFIDVFGGRFSNDDDAFSRIAAWYMAADSLREVRNRLAHGRWGILPHAQLVVHVSGYPPEVQTERRFALWELDALIAHTDTLNKELAKLPW